MWQGQEASPFDKNTKSYAEVVVMLSFFVYLLRLKNIIALAPFHQEFELTSFQCQLKGPNKVSLLMLFGFMQSF
jgi:hypothetical protein